MVDSFKGFWSFQDNLSFGHQARRFFNRKFRKKKHGLLSQICGSILAEFWPNEADSLGKQDETGIGVELPIQP
jgi:hypothetical protein